MVPTVCHWCRYTGGNFTAGVVDTAGNLPPALLTPVAKPNLPPVSLILVTNLTPVSLIPVAILLPVLLIPVVHLDLRISLRIFEKIWNGPTGILRGWGQTDSWKNQKQKISWHSPFNRLKNIPPKVQMQYKKTGNNLYFLILANFHAPGFESGSRFLIQIRIRIQNRQMNANP